MIRTHHARNAALCAAALLLIGCSSSKESGERDAWRPEGKAGEAASAESLRAQDRTETPSSGQHASSRLPGPPPESAAGMFAVQIGAHAVPDGASRIAATAQERFARSVYALHDRASGLIKILIGDFPTKDEARRFRDQIVSQFPDDYKDAWVTEIPRTQ